MSSDAAELMEKARQAAEGSYSPYSGFRVGAVVVTADGMVYTGANVENAAYGSSVCAEANAITTAVAAGARKIDTMAVACLDSGGECYPCGNCRQLMREFEVERVIVQDGEGGVRQHSRDELIPHSFGPEDLS